MATEATQLTDKEQEILAGFEPQTVEATGIIEALGTSLVNVTEYVQKLARVIVAVRMSIIIPQPSKTAFVDKDGKKVDKGTPGARGKTVDLPDLTGHSKQYRTWFSKAILPLLVQHIPDDLQGSIDNRLQKQVQAEARRQGTSAQLSHLGMSVKQANARQAEAKAKREAEATRKAETRQSEEMFSSDGIAAAIQERAAEVTGIRETAMFVARGNVELAKVVTAMAGDIPAKEREAIDTLLKQSIRSLMEARAAIETATPKKAAATPKKAAATA